MSMRRLPENVLHILSNAKSESQFFSLDRKSASPRQSPLQSALKIMEKKAIYLTCQNRILCNNTHFEVLPRLL